MHRNKTVMAHAFSMIPKADIPRSSFRRPHGYKTTFDSGYLIPVFWEHVLPGDTHKLNSTLFARLATPIYPIMDNLYLDSFFFFVPYRLLWTHWVNFMGEQNNPSDSISYTVPNITSPTAGWVANSLMDYFGFPTVGQVGGSNTVTHNNFLGRAYNLIWHDWFRDENLQNAPQLDTGDGPDTAANYVLLRRGKRHDYFTSCLPWPQKGGTAVTLPLSGTAPVIGNGIAIGFTDGSTKHGLATNSSSAAAFRLGSYGGTVGAAAGSTDFSGSINIGLTTDTNGNSGMVADLALATGATINAIRLAFQTQRLLERDARGGTRYTEIVRSHFGVISPDARLQRPEYLGGGTTPVNINPIAQTSGTSASGTTTPLGNLAAMGTLLAKRHGFTKSFTEHGVIIGLISVRADLNYQQGLNCHESRTNRYSYFFPAFSMLGEQAVLNQEIYCDGSGASGNDGGVFGYQEAWAEYRYKPSVITGQFRSTYATPLDAWHLAIKFTSLPSLNSTFIQDNPPVNRVVAVGSGATGAQFILDAFHDLTSARPMPMYSVPGMIDHF